MMNNKKIYAFLILINALCALQIWGSYKDIQRYDYYSPDQVPVDVYWERYIHKQMLWSYFPINFLFLIFVNSLMMPLIFHLRDGEDESK